MHSLWVTFGFLSVHHIIFATGLANASNTEITTPGSGLPQNSSILDTTKSSFIITANDSLGGAAGNSELFWVELNKEGTCEIGYGSISCQVLCYPFTEPHIAAKQCESSYYTQGRVTKTSDTALWVIANVESSGSSEYTVTYYESVEVSDHYIVTIYLLINGGLFARYWDNIWFTGTESVSEIASEINYQWGADAAITTYGTDYISARWEGKISPPYNETYKFYLYADDGSRLWINKQLIIDGWDECCNESWGAVNLTANIFHDIIVEYKEIRADAYIELRWSSDSIAKSIVPSTYLYYQTHIKDSPFDASPIYISSGNVSYEQTVVNDETQFQNNIAGVNNSVYVTAKDPFGHVLDTDTALFNITNLDGMTSIQEWEGSGIYKITFMALTKTANSGKPFHIELNNNDILNSPYTVYVDPAATSPLNSSLVGDGLSSAVSGFSAYFNITVYDIYGNERESDGDIINVRFYGTAAGHGTCEYLMSDRGIYSCLYTLKQTGVYTPEITINDVVHGESLTINVSSGVIHGPSCNILNFEALNTTVSAGYLQNITIQSRDQFGNALSTSSDDYVVNISDGTNTINASVSSIGDGQYSVTFVPSIAASYDVNILLDNTTHIVDSPYTLTVIPGDAVASTSYVIDGNGHNTAQSNIETYFLVQLRDLYGNTLVTANSTVFDLSILSCASINETVYCDSYQSGQYNCSYTPIESGQCLLYLTISNNDITNSPFSVTVSPGDISPIYTFAHRIQDGVAGSIQSFMIQAQDSNGNNLTAGGNTFTVKLIDLHYIYSDVLGDIIDNTDGSYTVNYLTEIANVYEALTVELIAVGGLLANYYTDYSFTNLYSIYGENVIDSQIAFDWGYGTPLSSTDNFPSSDYFSVQWIGYLYPPYSETYTVYTNVYGGSGIRLYIDNDLLIDQFDPQYGETDPFIIIQLTANTFYFIQIDFREETGEAKLSLEWESASIDRRAILSDYLYYIVDIGGSSNVSIIPSTTLASECSVSGDGLTSAIAGFITTLYITAKDIYQNIQTHAGNEESNFKIFLVNQVGNQMNGTVVDSGNNGTDGEYTATYTVTNTSQQHTLYITYNGANVASSPYLINVTPGNLSDVQSSAVLTHGRAGESQIFSLYIRDDYANLMNSDAVSVSLILTHNRTGTTVTTTDIVNNNNGIYTITYSTSLSGQYTPSITMNDTVLTTITAIVNISSAIASSSNSYIKGWGSGAVGSISLSTNVVKVIQLLDIYSNLVSVSGGYNFYVSLQNSSGALITQPIITDGPNGTYFINFTSASSQGTYYLNVLLASGDINNADGLTGEYFNNRWLYDVPYNTKVDTNISLNWGHNLITETAKNFVSVRWSGYIKPSYGETYTLTITSDDGSRLYIDNELIFDNFLSNAGSFSGNHTFNIADLLYPIKIEYRENTGNANITLQWQSVSQNLEIVPQTALFSNASHIKSSPFTLTIT